MNRTVKSDKTPVAAIEPRNGQNGTALIAVLGLAAALLILVSVFPGVVVMDATDAQRFARMNKTRYAAQAGIGYALADIRESNPDAPAAASWRKMAQVWRPAEADFECTVTSLPAIELLRENGNTDWQNWGRNSLKKLNSPGNPGQNDRITLPQKLDQLAIVHSRGSIPGNRLEQGYEMTAIVHANGKDSVILLWRLWGSSKTRNSAGEAGRT